MAANSAEREKRLAEALRANLKRRKARQRLLEEPGPERPGEQRPNKAENPG